MTREEVLELLNSKPNDEYRKITQKGDSMYAFDYQIESAKEIVSHLAAHFLRTNHIMLVSPMQGGKTGTLNSVVNIIESVDAVRQSMAVSRYFFISGMNDCGLKSQTLERVISQVTNANESNVCVGGKCKADSSHKYFVLKNSDLLPYDGSIDNSVVFIDEAHFGSGERNVLTKFLIKQGVDWKNQLCLQERGIYIVSVSATLYDELVSDEINSKKMVVLKTDDDYVGVSNYIQRGCVHNAEPHDIIEGGQIFEYIENARRKMIENYENGVIIIRTQRYDIIKDHPIVKQYFDIYEMDSTCSKIQYDKFAEKLRMLEYFNDKVSRRLKKNGPMMENISESLSEADKSLTNALVNNLSLESDEYKSAKPLIVLVKGAFRAGMTIDSEYKKLIYMVYDNSTTAMATPQALLGRMCGYRRGKNLDLSKCDFYINLKFAEMYSDWESDFSDKSKIPSDKTEYKWVEADDDDCNSELASKCCGNLAIPLSDKEIREIYGLCHRQRSAVRVMESLLPKLLKKRGYDISYDYLMEAQMKGKNNYAKSSQIRRFDSFNEEIVVFPFRPANMKDFINDTQRDYLSDEDLGKKCVSVVLDANIIDGGRHITGNRRLLVYYVEVAKRKKVISRKGQYKPHKDTRLQ